MSRTTRVCDRIIWFSLVIYCFFAAISVSISEGAVFLAIIAWFVKSIAAKKLNWQRTPLDKPVLAFVIVALVTCFLGMDVSRSLIGVRTYGLILIIFLVLNNVPDIRRMRLLLFVMIAGVTLASCRTIWVQLTATPPPPGNMTQAGILLIAIGCAVSLLLYEKKLFPKFFLVPAIALMGAAQVLNFKRGAWAGVMVVLLIQGWLKSRRLILLVVLIMVAILLLYPPAWQRVLKTRLQFETNDIPRVKIWRAVPQIIKEHPLGIGFGNSREVVEKYTGFEKKHFHNSFIQIALEMSIAGLAVFLWWMIIFLKMAYSVLRRTDGKTMSSRKILTESTRRDRPAQDSYRIYPAGQDEKAVSLAAFSVFIGFLVHGLVESNFADSEVVMLIYFLMGVVMILYRQTGCRD